MHIVHRIYKDKRTIGRRVHYWVLCLSQTYLTKDMQTTYVLYKWHIPLLHSKKTKKNRTKVKPRPHMSWHLFLYVCFFWFWGCGVGLARVVSFLFEILVSRWKQDGSTAQRPVLVCWWQNSRTEPKPKKQKTKSQNFEDTFWFRLKRCFFLVFLVFFCFFLVSKSKKPKNTWCFLVFPGSWLEAITKKPKKHQVFFVFLDFETKKNKKTQGKPKKTIFWV